MKIVRGLPPKIHGGVLGVDLELFDLRQKQLHRPFGSFGLLTISDGKTVWIVERVEDVERALDRIRFSTWAMHNANFDVRHLRRWGDVTNAVEVHDTLLVDRIFWGGWYDTFALDDTARRTLGVLVDKSLREEFYKTRVMNTAMLRYAATDSLLTARIAVKQLEMLDKDPMAMRAWVEIDRPALWAVVDFKGFSVDITKWLELADVYERRAEKVKRQLKINPASPKQVKAFLKEKLDVELESSDVSTLDYYRGNKWVDLILEFRESSKRATTYGRSLLNTYVEGGKIWANFNVSGAETGRMSSSSVNLQNVPADKEYRECFIASSGCELVVADYAAQEPRILAALSGDVELIDVFKRKENVHLEVTRTIFGNPDLTKKDAELYKQGKIVNLAMMYGMTAYGLAKRLGINERDAERYIESYFSRFWGVARWIPQQRKDVREVEHVRTLGGRFVWINPYMRLWGNNAVNSPIQGTASDVTKRALGLLHTEFPGQKYPVVATVHDEIVCDVPKKEVKKFISVFRDCLLKAFSDVVPQVVGGVDIGHGKTWAAAKQ